MQMHLRELCEFCHTHSTDLVPQLPSLAYAQCSLQIQICIGFDIRFSLSYRALSFSTESSMASLLEQRARQYDGGCLYW